MGNPYAGQDFFGFFATLFTRIFAFFTGQPLTLASDELQLLVLSAIAASGALVGTFLVLKKMTMLANALSHTILLGIILAFLLISHTLSIPILLIAALLSGLLTTFLTEFLSRVMKLQEDASIGLVFSVLFALGVVLVTLFSRNTHLGIELVMGNVDALQKSDLNDVFALLGINIALFLLFFQGLKITTFDSELARAFGFSPLFFNYLLMVQTALTSVGGFKAVGVVMILAFFVMPTLTARLLTHNLKTLIWLSIGFGILGSTIGVALSRHVLTTLGLGLSTGGIVVVILGMLFFISALVEWRRARAYTLRRTQS